MQTQVLHVLDGSLHCILALHSKCLDIHHNIGIVMVCQRIAHEHSPDSPCIGHNLDQTSLGDTRILQEQCSVHDYNSQHKWLQN